MQRAFNPPRRTFPSPRFARSTPTRRKSELRNEGMPGFSDYRASKSPGGGGGGENFSSSSLRMRLALSFVELTEQEEEAPEARNERYLNDLTYFAYARDRERE